MRNPIRVGNKLITGQHGFYPTLDTQLGHGFASAIQYFDQNGEIQSIRQTSWPAADSRSLRRQPTEKEILQHAASNSYFKAFLVKVTVAKADVSIIYSSAQQAG